MDRRKQEIAESLEISPDLLPYVPELLADVDALGCNAETIVSLLRPLGLLEYKTRVLDLGCGKGVLGLRLAEQLAFHVTGVDLFEPFIREARQLASERNLTDRCHFEVQDLRQALSDARDFDVVVYASLGVLGDLEHAVGELRRAVRPGGYCIIDDGYLARSSKLDAAGYGHYVDHEQTLQRLTAHQDRLLEEVIISSEDAEAYNRQTTERIRRRAGLLASRHPQLADRFHAYVERQESECRILETEFVSAVWLLQRSADGSIQRR